MNTDSRYLADKLQKGENVCNMQIVFANIFGYSERRVYSQVSTILALTDRLKRALGTTAADYADEMSRIDAHLQRDIVVLPTGDGLAAAFPFELPGISMAFVDQLVPAIDVHNTTVGPCSIFEQNGFCDCHNMLLLRVAVSEGPTVLYEDFNGQLNIAGDPVNVAARMTTLVEPGHVFLTNTAHRTLVEHVPGRDEQFRPYYQADLTDSVRLDIHQYTNAALPGLDTTPIVGLGRMDGETLANIDDSRVAAEPRPSTAHPEQHSSPASPSARVLCTNGMILKEDEQFTMGATPAGHVEVLFSRPFLVSPRLVTQDDYQAVMGRNPSRCVGGSNPVEMVSWFDAIQFCNELSALEGLDPVYVLDDQDVVAHVDCAGYRLPSEAEWELCCYSPESEDDRYGPIGAVAWYSANSDGQTHPVGGLRDHLGIYDLLGNVWEWCGDWFQRGHPGGSVLDYVGPESGYQRVLRGGSWRDLAPCITAHYRHHAVPKKRESTIGFRVARTVINSVS
jgi:sulfatase modifying factor 1